MVLEDEFTRILLDKIIQNVISCLPIIENISKVQHKKIEERIGVDNMRDFVLGAACVYYTRKISRILLSLHRKNYNL